MLTPQRKENDGWLSGGDNDRNTSNGGKLPLYAT